MTQRTSSSPLVSGTLRLRCVFDDDQPVLHGELVDWIHVSGLSVQVNRHDGASTGRNSRRDKRRINIEGFDVRLHWHRRSTALAHREPGGNEGIGRNNDLIAWADVVGAK